MVDGEELGWIEPALLVTRASGQPARAGGTLFEAVHRAWSIVDLTGVLVRCPAADLVLGRDELVRLFRTPGFATVGPVHGHEANALVLDGSSLAPIAPAFFRGGFDEACRRVWGLPADQRACAFVVTHGEILAPAMLEARRPPPVAAAPRRRWLNRLGLAG